LTPEFWRGRRVLVTGHTGFKGSWLALWLEQMGAEVSGLALAALGSDAGYHALQPCRGTSHIVDLRDPAAVTRTVVAAQPEIVFHLAAQALVRQSYADPVGTYAVNCQGTAHLFDAVRQAGSVRTLVVVTSDKVYANQDEGRPFVETDRLGGGDPYSNSKACVEVMTESWRKSFFAAENVAVATGRAGNVIGGGDNAADRLLPDLCRALQSNRALRLRNPTATRPWQFVLEPLAGYIELAEALARRTAGTPEAVNFGPGPEGAWPVERVIATALEQVGRGSWEQDGEPGPREAHYLSLDNSLARRSLGWRPRLSVESAIGWTVEWWRTAFAGGDLRELAERQLDAYRALP
jgi:CDP-glucose 4,6-dehydratase